MIKVNRLSDAADWIDSSYGKHLYLATPLGLGKPNQLLNLIYERIQADPSRSMILLTALSLQVPRAKSELEARFLTPFADRHFGTDYPHLKYCRDSSAHRLPPNIEIQEFYFQAGSAIGNERMQRSYISANYTHVAQAVARRNIPVILCLIAKHPERPNHYSLSCNPDLTIDLINLYCSMGKRMHLVGVIHPDLPYLGEEAEIEADAFDVVVDSPEVRHTLFALPREPVFAKDYLIGFRASLLMPDDGTLQVGIGSLSDALVHALILRHTKPKIYQEIGKTLIEKQPRNQKFSSEFHTAPFEKGIYGTSEMIMDAFMHLRERGILTREIFDSDEHIRRYLHGAFFLGSKPFYEWMQKRVTENDHGLCMTRVSKVNDLYDPHELAIRRQRKNARFYNMCLEITLLGGSASDTLPNGQVMSGVGGQYNFIAMSHELPDSHSVLLFHSEHEHGGQKLSNVKWGNAQQTISRHLRDVFITEHGFSFTRGETDEVVIVSNLELAAAPYQAELLEESKRNGKVAKDYVLPEHCKRNTSEAAEEFLYPYAEHFPAFPFGSDFTREEERLALALGRLKELLPHKLRVLELAAQGSRVPNARYGAELARMKLDQVSSISDRFYRSLVNGALQWLDEESFFRRASR